MIIWIASYPKSGNTWLRSLLCSYLYSEDGKFNFSLLKKIPLFPSKKYFEHFLNDFTDIKKISNYWIAAQDRINLDSNKTFFFKTHSSLCTLEKNPFTNRRNTQAVIYVVRDPRNVITSISNHFSKNIDQSFEFMINKNKMLTVEEWGSSNIGLSSVLGSWSDHYNSWKNINFAPIMIVKYESLIEDTQNTFLKIITFLNSLIGTQINKKKISIIEKNCNFEKLVMLEKEEGFSEAATSLNDEKKVNFFHLGIKNNWKNLLNANVEKKITEKFNLEMKELDYI